MACCLLLVALLGVGGEGGRTPRLLKQFNSVDEYFSTYTLHHDSFKSTQYLILYLADSTGNSIRIEKLVLGKT